MKTFLVSGSDTGIGKTWVVGSLARALVERGLSVQLVKPIETGVPDAVSGDASDASGYAGEGVSAFTLRTFTRPMAPLHAARLQNAGYASSDLCKEIRALPDCDVRLVEGAGGIAVPLSDDGSDWANFGQMLEVDGVVIVVENRLGAINQARLCMAYAQQCGLRSGVWLNDLHGVEMEIAMSNRVALSECGVGIVGETGQQSRESRKLDWDWFGV